MLQWLDSVAGPGYVAAILWTFAALILLVVILLVIKVVRNLTFGTFVAGGRNRKTRLAVMDATAVDSHRRLVLVRRDDIEHLILIGGPTDVVVERDIRLAAPRRPALTGDSGQPQATAACRPASCRRTPARAGGTESADRQGHAPAEQRNDQRQRQIHAAALKRFRRRHIDARARDLSRRDALPAGSAKQTRTQALAR